MEAREGPPMGTMQRVVCAKGEFVADPGECAAKFAGQVGGSRAGTTSFVGPVYVDARAGPSSGADRSGSLSVPFNISSGGGAAFDCSALSGALDSALLMPSDLPEIFDEEEPADVFVPGAARPVVISRQMILKEIARQLNLEVHDFGTIDGFEGLARGWIEIDIPRQTSDGQKEKEKFIGEEALSRYAAMESVSADVIRELCRGSGVIIQDVNYDDMKKLERKLVEEKWWSNLFCGKVGAMTKEDEAFRRGYENVVTHAKTMCKEFKDVLPIETAGEQDLFLATDNVKIAYNGPRYPVTRMEQLAFDLVSLVKKSVDLQVSGREERMEHVPLKRKRYRCHE